MKTRITTLLAAAALVCTAAGAQAQNYQQGDKLLNVGIGLGSTFLNSGLKSTLPPLGASFEYGFTENISAGAYVGYAGASQDIATFGGEWKFKYSYVIVGARGSYHIALTDKLDTYAGAMLGYNNAKATITKPSGYSGPDMAAAEAGGVIWGGHLGARYLFTEKVGAFGELGYGIAWLNLGLTAKF